MATRSATREDFDSEGLIGRYTACDMAGDKLRAAGFILLGRSEKSEASYYGRPNTSKPRLRVAAHDGRREDVGVYVDFEDCATTHVETEMEIEGEDEFDVEASVETHEVKHTGLDEGDLDTMIAEAIADYDAQPDQGEGEDE